MPCAVHMCVSYVIMCGALLAEEIAFQLAHVLKRVCPTFMRLCDELAVKCIVDNNLATAVASLVIIFPARMGNRDHFAMRWSPTTACAPFIPKALGESYEMLEMRPTMFGAAALGHLTSLPQSQDSGTLWEAWRAVNFKHTWCIWILAGDHGFGCASADPGCEAEVLAHSQCCAKGGARFEALSRDVAALDFAAEK